VHEIKCLAELMAVEGLEKSRLEQIIRYSDMIIIALDKELISEDNEG